MTERGDWSPQETRLLNCLWHAGFSATQIGDKIGRNRCKVLGKVFRMRRIEGIKKWPHREPGRAYHLEVRA